jgi:hypothetical protein
MKALSIAGMTEKNDIRCQIIETAMPRVREEQSAGEAVA